MGSLALGAGSQAGGQDEGEEPQGQRQAQGGAGERGVGGGAARLRVAQVAGAAGGGRRAAADLAELALGGRAPVHAVLLHQVPRQRLLWGRRTWLRRAATSERHTRPVCSHSTPSPSSGLYRHHDPTVTGILPPSIPRDGPPTLGAPKQSSGLGCRDPFLGPGITHSWSWSCRSASWPRSPAASYSRWHWSIRDSEEPGLQGESVRGPHQPRGGPSGGPDQHGEAPQGRRDARAHSSERPLLDRATRALGLSPLRYPGACQGSCLTHNLGRWEGHPCPLGP